MQKISSNANNLVNEHNFLSYCDGYHISWPNWMINVLRLSGSQDEVLGFLTKPWALVLPGQRCCDGKVGLMRLPAAVVAFILGFIFSGKLQIATFKIEDFYS